MRGLVVWNRISREMVDVTTLTDRELQDRIGEYELKQVPRNWYCLVIWYIERSKTKVWGHHEVKGVRFADAVKVMGKEFWELYSSVKGAGLGKKGSGAIVGRVFTEEEWLKSEDKYKSGLSWQIEICWEL